MKSSQSTSAEQPRPVLALEDADQRQAGVDDQDAGGADAQRELGAAEVGPPAAVKAPMTSKMMPGTE